MPAARDLRFLVGAVGLSSLGDRVALVPLALLVEHRGGTGLAVAALFVAMWSPAALLLASVVGVVFVSLWMRARVRVAVAAQTAPAPA